MRWKFSHLGTFKEKKLCAANRWWKALGVFPGPMWKSPSRKVMRWNFSALLELILFGLECSCYSFCCSQRKSLWTAILTLTSPSWRAFIAGRLAGTEIEGVFLHACRLMAFIVILICLWHTEDCKLCTVLSPWSNSFIAGRPAGTEMNGVLLPFEWWRFLYSC